MPENETPLSTESSQQPISSLNGEVSQNLSSGELESGANNNALAERVNGLDLSIKIFESELKSLKADAIRVEKRINLTSHFVSTVALATVVTFSFAAIPLFRDFYKDNSELYRKALEESVRLNEKVNHLEKMYKSSCNL
jgi:hypothetical protein